jgi:glycerol uptake facilitator protein
VKQSIWGALTAEFIGTALLVFLGDGVVATAVLFGAYQGQWQPSVLWGLSVTTVVYVIGAVSGAHINPAVTLAQAIFRKFGWMKAVYYWIAQMLGGFGGAALLFAVIKPVLDTKGMTDATARIFSCFPGANVTTTSAFLMEVILTMMLVLVILGINDAKNEGAPKAGMGALIVGATVALLVGIGGPWTMASLNPARDLGPRLWMLVAGWDPTIALGGSYWWVPVVGPLVGGGIVAGLIYDYLVHPFIPGVSESEKKVA